MNNEPVGHLYPEGEGATIYDIKFAWKVTGTTEPIPLYTHPANLTDEEITEIFDTTFEVRDFEDSFIKFARAILRKAQE